MKRFFQNVLIFVLISTVLSEPPVFSENYAKIRYQPRENWEGYKAELNLDERHREEVTEKFPPLTTKSPQSKTDIELSQAYDITTEQESEQINLARFIYKNIVKDKLVQGNKNDSTNLFDESNTTDVSQENLTVIHHDENSNGTTYNGNITAENENFVTEDSEELDDLDQSEVSDLNEQGVYYIYHPYMLLQKVVYRTQDNPDNMEFSTEMNYENVAPIVEPIYTYDPRTFVLQRLILRPQEQT